MTIVTLVSGRGYAYPGDCTRDGGGQAGRAMGEKIGVSRDLLITTL
jgi:hypothetical protein